MSRLIPYTMALAFVVSAASFVLPTPGRADADAPVCARIYDQGGSYDQCDFYNYGQCKATISGRSGECFDNRRLRNSLNQMPARWQYRR